MMQSLLTAALMNAATASVLAGVVWCITQFCRNPAVNHFLWLVVLLKLVSPPLFAVPLDLRVLMTSGAETATDAKVSAADRPGGDDAMHGKPQPRVDLSAEVVEGQRGIAAVSLPVSINRRADGQSAPPRASSFSDATVRGGTYARWLPFVVAIWFGVSILLLGVAASRIARFHRLLKCGSTAPPWFDAMVASLAATMGVRSCPDVRIVDAHVPPLLWPLGRRPMIVVSRTLLENLTKGELRTLIAHELAHLRRRDHLVRWLELAVLAVYWWHPVAWWARHMLRRTEEEACDALVVGTLRGDGLEYATALVRTVDLLAGPGRVVPAISSGLFGNRPLKHRIAVILETPPHHRVGWPMGLLVVSIGGLLLPLSVGGVTQEHVAPTAEANSPQVGDTADSGPQLKGLDLFGDLLPEGAIARLGTVRFRHISHTLAVAISPDSSKIVSSSYYGDVRLWETDTGRLIRVWKPNRGIATNAVAFSPDGALVAAGGEGSVVWIWDAESGEVAHQIRIGPFEENHIYGIAFAPDGLTLATGHASGTVRIWDVTTGRLLLKLERGEARSGQNHALAFSPDGKLLASASDEPRQGLIEIWRLDFNDKELTLGGANPHTLDVGRNHDVVSIAFTPDGSELIAGYVWRDVTRSNRVLIWNPQTGDQPRELKRDDGDAGASVAISKDGRILATATRSEVTIWDFRTGEPLQTMGGFHNRYLQHAHNLALSPDGNRAAVTTGWGTAILVWDAVTGELLPKPLESHASNLNVAGFIASDQIATSDRMGIIRTWDAETGEPTRSIHPDGDLDRRGSVAAEGIFLKAFAMSDRETSNTSGLVQFWDVRTGALHGQHSVPTDVTSTAITPDGILAAAAYSGEYPLPMLAHGEDKSQGIRVWDTVSGRQLGDLKLPQGYAIALAFARDRRTLYYVEFNHESPDSLYSWNFQTGQRTPVIERLEGAELGTEVAYSRDAQILVICDRERGQLHVYDTVERKQRMTIELPQTFTSVLAIAPDNATLATACVQVFSAAKDSDEAIYLWDLQTGEQIKKLGQPDAAVTAMDFSSDGQRLVTATTMGTALVWDVR